EAVPLAPVAAGAGAFLGAVQHLEHGAAGAALFAALQPRLVDAGARAGPPATQDAPAQPDRPAAIPAARPQAPAPAGHILGGEPAVGADRPARSGQRAQQRLPFLAFVGFRGRHRGVRHPRLKRKPEPKAVSPEPGSPTETGLAFRFAVRRLGAGL